MRVLTIDAIERQPALLEDVADVLREEGLVCLPVQRQYAICALLHSAKAVVRLVQAKRRSGSAPSLVLIPDTGGLGMVTDEQPPSLDPLFRTFWPGALTILFRPTAGLPGKVLKTIGSKKTAKVGVRVPAEGFALDLTRTLRAPLLVSSANISQKRGAASVASIRKEFSRTVDLFVDAGDLPSELPSTIIDWDVVGAVRLVREGVVPLADIEKALQAGAEG